MSRFAEGTSVAVDKTKADIERELVRFGATAFTSGFEGNRAFILFRARDRLIRLTLTLPDLSDPTISKTALGKSRTAVQTTAAFDAEKRRLWRSLLLLVKAKLAAVADGIVEFEEEFLPHIVLSNKETVWERSRSGIAIEYQSGQVQSLLPPPKKDSP